MIAIHSRTLHLSCSSWVFTSIYSLLSVSSFDCTLYGKKYPSKYLNLTHPVGPVLFLATGTIHVFQSREKTKSWNLFMYSIFDFQTSFPSQLTSQFFVRSFYWNESYTIRFLDDFQCHVMSGLWGLGSEGVRARESLVSRVQEVGARGWSERIWMSSRSCRSLIQFFGIQQ